MYKALIINSRYSVHSMHVYLKIRGTNYQPLVLVKICKVETVNWSMAVRLYGNSNTNLTKSEKIIEFCYLFVVFFNNKLIIQNDWEIETFNFTHLHKFTII